MSVVELSLYGEATLKQEFSIIPPTNNWIPEYVIDYKKKCCNNCDYKLVYDKGNITMCIQQVSNSLNSDIVNSDTFYCSYHKLKFNNE